MDRDKILGQLRLKGFSLASWAAENGFKADSVRHVVIRVYSGKIPRRGQAKDIWEKLLFTIKGGRP